MSTPIIVFYSPKCKYCTSLLSKLQSLPIEYKLLNIHDPSFDPKSYTFLKQVPTIIAKDSAIPFEGKLAFQYLETRGAFEQSTCDVTKASMIRLNHNSELLRHNPNRGVEPFTGDTSGIDINAPTLIEIRTQNNL